MPFRIMSNNSSLRAALSYCSLAGALQKKRRLGGGAAGRTPERKFGKLRLRAWLEPRSQRPGLKLGRQAEQKLMSKHTSFGDQGCSEKGKGKGKGYTAVSASEGS